MPLAVLQLLAVGNFHGAAMGIHEDQGRKAASHIHLSGDGEKQGFHRIPPSLLQVHDYMIT